MPNILSHIHQRQHCKTCPPGNSNGGNEQGRKTYSKKHSLTQSKGISKLLTEINDVERIIMR